MTAPLGPHGGKRAQKRKCMTLLMGAVTRNDYAVHKRIIEMWIKVCKDPDHPQYMPALREYNKYVLGVPVQEHEVKVSAPMTTTVTPTMLAAAGIISTEVDDIHDDGTVTTRTEFQLGVGDGSDN